MMGWYDGYYSYGWNMFWFICMTLTWTIGIVFLIAFIRFLVSASTPSNVKRRFHSDGCVHDPESHAHRDEWGEEIDDVM